MNSLRAERRRLFTLIPTTWRKAAAAAAALMVMAAGTAGFVGLRITSNWVVGYKNTPVQTIGENTPTIEGSFKPPAETSGGAAGTDNIPENTGNIAKTGSDNPTLAGGNGLHETVTNSSSSAGSPPVEQRVLLSNGMSVSSTILKLSVDDLALARAKAVALAASTGADTQVFPEQSAGKKMVVLRLTVTSGQTPDLITGLYGLGNLVDRQDENRDITTIYNETLVQYHNLQSQLSTVQNAEEQQRLQAQSEAYKQQLATWESENGKRVVTLWLEN